MESPVQSQSVDTGALTSPARQGDSRVWYLVGLGLVAWQGWMTLTLFGPDHPWERLLDDQPVISGRHALHLYHGMLGAQSLRERGRLSCYDPAFQAGYPKTPIFDSGSRPAELFLTVAEVVRLRPKSHDFGHGAGATPNFFPAAAAYKIGLAFCCCLAPLLLMLAGHGFGLSWGLSCAGAALGQ